MRKATANAWRASWPPGKGIASEAHPGSGAIRSNTIKSNQTRSRMPASDAGGGSGRMHGLLQARTWPQATRRARNDTGGSPMNYAFRMKLKPGNVAEYQPPPRRDLARARAAAARSRHLRLFDLPRRGRRCTCSRCSSCATDNTREQLPQHPVMRRWWDYMRDLMETHPDGRPHEWPLVPLFHLD